jgi:hypothetical protein
MLKEPIAQLGAIEKVGSAKVMQPGNVVDPVSNALDVTESPTGLE